MKNANCKLQIAACARGAANRTVARFAFCLLHFAICVLPSFSTAMLIVLVPAATQAADGTDLPAAQPVPDVQVLPLPDGQASFQFLGRELTRSYFSPLEQRPFWYPVIGPSGRSLTRIGHPHDPQTHGHHNSIWIAHQNVNGVNFWEDHGGGRIVHQRVELYEDGPQSAAMLTVNAWQAPDGRSLLLERRRASVEVQPGGQWCLYVDLQLEAPVGHPVTLGATPFGLIAVRMAKTIGVHDGGGRILDSEGRLNEKAIFHKPARWVDYSGPITKTAREGIALMDHPSNPGSPTPFHVRDDGWMGASLTCLRPLTIAPGKPLRLRYAIWIHANVVRRDEVDQRWQAFAKSPAPLLTPHK
jgi:hypothetical protein